MPRKRTPEELSVDELRWLLMEKRRSVRRQRLERYRRTGRVVMVASDTQIPSLDSWNTSDLLDEAEPSPAPSLRRRILDGFLLLVEVGAVVGLVLILFNGVRVLRDLNREAVSQMALPTLTPTPLLTAIVLPSGHTPPTSPGGTSFNEAEIPEHLRPLMQSLSNVPIPTPGPEQAVRIQIPAINIDAPVVQGDGWEQLKKGVGQHIGTANPGKAGNVVLSAHNDIFGELFRDLDRLKPGDSVILFTNQRIYTYIITDSQVVEPTAVEVMDASAGSVVTLISCYPYLKDNQRIVVSAQLKSGN